jgi:hypothetical protein
MTTRTYTVSEKKRALEIAAWSRLISGALKRRANGVVRTGEIKRATSFLPLHPLHRATSRNVSEIVLTPGHGPLPHFMPSGSLSFQVKSKNRLPL